MENDIFDINDWNQEFPEYTEEDRKKETEVWLASCGSCINFVSLPFAAEAGFCKIAECNCLCKNPKAMIDIFDNKCEKWNINPEYL